MNNGLVSDADFPISRPADKRKSDMQTSRQAGKSTWREAPEQDDRRIGQEDMQTCREDQKDDITRGGR